MRPLALLAGGLAALSAMGIAHGQTVTTARPAVMLQTPLNVPVTPGVMTLEQQRTAFAAGGDLVLQNVTEIRRPSGARSVDTLRLVTAASAVTPAGFASPLVDPAQIRDDAYELDYSRAWPGAVSHSASGYLIDLTPEARFGYGAGGGSIGGGATVRVMSPRTDARVVERLAKMGVEDGAQFGEQSRFYLFAAASGRAVGMNVINTDAGLSPGGWTTDPAALVGDAQIGVGWRKGDVQTSLGYMVRRVRVEDKYAQRFVDLPSSDQVAGISFSYKPQPRR